MPTDSPTFPSAAAPTRPAMRRLPGRSPLLRARYVARTRLWLDGAQLVQESVRYYTQEIQRFNLADIQAVQLRRTPRGLVYNVVLTLLLAGLVAITIFADDPLDTRLKIGACLGLPLLVLLAVNVLRGPTCRATLVTALGPQLLPSLSRVPATRRALALLSANLAAVQGEWPPDEAAQAVEAARASSPTAPVPAAGAAFQG